MGHVRLGTLPRTRRWQEVVALIEHGAAVEQVAQATIHAAEQGLKKAAGDKGVVETVWLLTRLPHAARAGRYREALYELGVTVPAAPSLMELVGAFSAAVDARLPNNNGRTDLGEMAQMAGAEALAGVLAEKTASLFETTPDDVRRELAGLHTVSRFGAFARQYFARFSYKTLDYFLSRTLSDHVGEGRRFVSLARVAEFSAALELHCREAAVIVERFTGEWVSSTRWREGEVTREHAVLLVGGAMNKLTAELKVGASLDVE